MGIFNILLIELVDYYTDKFTRMKFKNVKSFENNYKKFKKKKLYSIKKIQEKIIKICRRITIVKICIKLLQFVMKIKRV